MNNEDYFFDSNYIITFIKIIAILYVSVLFVIFGLTLNYCLDKYIFNCNNISIDDASIDKMNLFYIIITTALIIGCISIVSHIGKNLVQNIPFPFEGINGFEYMNVSEVAGGGLLIVFMIAFSQTVLKKYKQLRYKLHIH